MLNLKIAVRAIHGSQQCYRKKPDLSSYKGPSAKKVLSFISSASLSKSNEIPTNEVKQWAVHRESIKKKLKGESWNPPKRLSRQSMESVRLLRENFPELTASDLAEQFKVSPESISRILKSKWRPLETEIPILEMKWKRRGERIKEMYDKQEINSKDGIIRPVKNPLLLKYNNELSKLSYKQVKQRNTRGKKDRDKLFLLQNLIAHSESKKSK